MRFGRGRFCAAAFLVCIVVLSLGCARAPSESRLSDEIHAKFKQDSGLQDKSITVQIAGGVVTLSGVVDNDAERTAAARYASMTPGIKEVVNNLQIPTAAPTGELARNQEPAAPAPAPSAPEPRARPSVPLRRESRPSPGNSANHQSHSSTSPANAESGAPDSSKASVNTNPSPEERQIADASSASSPKADAANDTPSAPQPLDAPTAPDSGQRTGAKLMTIEAGTPLTVRLVDGIDSETAQVGQTFRATLDSPLSVEWDVAIPAGYNVEGHVEQVKSAGKFSGQSELVLTLDKILVHDKAYDIQTDEYRRKGKNQSTNTAEKVGVGAALGAIIGGIAGGGKGAGIGAAAGGGLGGASQAASKGVPVRLSSETVLHFTLQSPVTVTQVEQGPEQDRRKLQPAK